MDEDIEGIGSIRREDQVVWCGRMEILGYDLPGFCDTI